MTFEFEAEWTRAKGEAMMRLASAGPSPAPTAQPSPGASPSAAEPDLGLVDGSVRSKASAIRTANAEARGKSTLDDAEAVGRGHAGWVAGAAGNDCVGTWQRRLRELADLVDDAADALTSGTNPITNEDQAIAGRLRAPGRSTGAGSASPGVRPRNASSSTPTTTRRPRWPSARRPRPTTTWPR
ncbi:hypothetical protein ACFV9E_20110 [Streptomyces sp. NPDC059835]|uniref:hypothetical protein n=1 Tax=Streptomyces sp. NPDC059835 TaxID=3346967 RepID=UPI0036609D4C